MNGLPLIISKFTGNAGRICDIATQLFEDRLNLIGLELREAKIRLVQTWILACIGMVFSILGLFLLILAGVYALPSELRLYGLVGVAIVCMLVGVIFFFTLSRNWNHRPLVFEQSIAELKKDMKCSLTKS